MERLGTRAAISREDSSKDRKKSVALDTGGVHSSVFVLRKTPKSGFLKMVLGTERWSAHRSPLSPPWLPPVQNELPVCCAVSENFQATEEVERILRGFPGAPVVRAREKDRKNSTRTVTRMGPPLPNPSGVTISSLDFQRSPQLTPLLQPWLSCSSERWYQFSVTAPPPQAS